VVPVIGVSKRHHKSRIGYALHERDKP
jgi:hypothetical protein